MYKEQTQLFAHMNCFCLNEEFFARVVVKYLLGVLLCWCLHLKAYGNNIIKRKHFYYLL